MAEKGEEKRQHWQTGPATPVKGVTFSKKANSWLAYFNKNKKDKANVYLWCSSREEAEEKLKTL